MSSPSLISSELNLNCRMRLFAQIYKLDCPAFSQNNLTWLSAEAISGLVCALLSTANLSLQIEWDRLQGQFFIFAYA